MATTHQEAHSLTSSPADGLAAELLSRRRKRLPALTLGLIILVAAALAFCGGIEVNKHWGKTSTASASTPSGLAGGLGGSAPFGFAGPPGGPASVSGSGAVSSGGAGGFAGGGLTSGTVTLIKGSTLYVTDATGNTVLVHTTARSQVTKTVGGTMKTIHPGDSLTVIGTKNGDGSYSARQLTIGADNG
jgi:hypothetical protein